MRKVVKEIEEDQKKTECTFRQTHPQMSDDVTNEIPR